MKAEEKTVAFMFFSVVMQFVYSLEGGGGGGGGGGGEGGTETTTKKKTKKNRIWGVGEGDRRAKF